MVPFTCGAVTLLSCTLPLMSRSSLLLAPELVYTWTDTAPLCANSGTYATTRVSDHRLIGAATPSIKISLSALIAPKFSPKIRSLPAIGRVAADMPSIRGAGTCAAEIIDPGGAVAARQKINRARNDLSEFFTIPLYK